MVKELSSMDLYYLTKELKALESSKVDRIYHTKENPQELLIIVHVTGKGKQILRVILPSMIFMDNTKDEQGTATGLCMMLRKYLEGSILTQIEQVSFERVLILTFRKKEEKHHLIIELFGQGNMIFCDGNLRILNTLHEEHWKDREIKRKQEYMQPISNDIMKLTPEEAASIIKDSRRESLVKILAIEFSLGGVYAEELCALEGIDKENKDVDAKKVVDGIRALLSKNIKANSSSGKVFPFELKTRKAEKYYETFNDAIAQNVELKDTEKEHFERQIAKIDLIVTEQTKILDKTEKDIVENHSKAEAIYEKYQKVQEIMNILNEARKKHSWKEIKEKIKDDGKFSKVIKDIDEKNNTVTIELDEL